MLVIEEQLPVIRLRFLILTESGQKKSLEGKEEICVPGGWKLSKKIVHIHFGGETFKWLKSMRNESGYGNTCRLGV